MTDQLPRLIAHVVLNKSIRMSLDKDPEIAAKLIDKVEERSPIPIRLVGWILLVLGFLVAISLVIDGEELQGKK